MLRTVDGQSFYPTLAQAARKFEQFLNEESHDLWAVQNQLGQGSRTRLFETLRIQLHLQSHLPLQLLSLYFHLHLSI